MTQEDLLRQARGIHWGLERYGGITWRRLQEERAAVEAAICVALDTTGDRSGRTAWRPPADAAGSAGGARSSTTTNVLPSSPATGAASPAAKGAECSGAV